MPVIAALAAISALTGEASAQTASRLSGDYVCAYGCRLTDANPSLAVSGDAVDCINEFGGLFRGRVSGADGLECFNKTGRLSRDGTTLTWSDGVVWIRHNELKASP